MKTLLKSAVVGALLATGLASCGDGIPLDHHGRVDVVVTMDIESTYLFLLDEVCNGNKACADDLIQRLIQAAGSVEQ